MSALYLINQADPARRDALEKTLQASLGRQGFHGCQRAQWVGGVVGWYETPANPSSNDQWCSIGDGFVACVGTLFYRGASGRAALEAFWHGFEDLRSASAEDLSGEYQVVINKAGQVWSFGDALGMIKLYEVPQAGVLSSSWLACAQLGEGSTLDPVGTLDYLFSGANHGTRTPIAEVNIVDPAMVLNLTAGTRNNVFGAAFWQPEDYFSNQTRALDLISQRLVTMAGAYARGFHDHVKSALSGGFDSRLILAALLAAGERPRLHVYGSPDNEDVLVAQTIDHDMQLDLRAIDKRALDREIASGEKPDLASNLAFFDGLPSDGILDDGSDRATRQNQSRDGSLALNGGGGEVLRNFFYLSDRRFSAADIVKVFYSGFDPAAVRNASALRAFKDYLASTIEAAVGATGLLSRQHVELIYPLIRGRYWTSRNNSMAARCGHFLTPFLDPQIVKASVRLPMSWKDYGRFEAKLIGQINPALAQYQMAYGFSPEQGPPASYRLKMWLQHQRPPWVRAGTASLKRRIKALQAELRGSNRASTTPPLTKSPLSDLIDPALLTSDDQLTRLRTLEIALGYASV